MDCQRCINLYPELNEIGTGKEKEVAHLVSTPGLRLLSAVGAGPHRGSWTVSSSGELYMVSGNGLYKVASDWTSTLLGTLNTASGRVSMADNGLQLAVVDGGPNVFVWDFGTSAFSTVPLPAFGTNPAGASQIVYQDGYFVLIVPNSQIFNISGLKEVTFDALDFSSSEANPDNLVALLSDHKDLWLFNSNTCEVFFDSGGTTIVDGSPQPLFPFTPINGAFVENGCGAAFSVAKMNGTVFWLGQDDKGTGMVYQAQGYQPVRVSTHAVETAIKSYGDTSGATSYTYQDGGHSFYCLNFPGADTTWVFDTATKLWHERAYFFEGQYQRHRAETHAFAHGAHVVGDYENGNIYELTNDVMDDNGQPIRRRRTAPHMGEGLKRRFYSDFQLDIEAGVGLDGAGQGTDPQVMLRYSDDGGHSWSGEVWGTMGKIGQTSWRALWRRLGQSRDRVFEVTITDPVKVAIIGAELNFALGVS